MADMDDDAPVVPLAKRRKTQLCVRIVRLLHAPHTRSPDVVVADVTAGGAPPFPTRILSDTRFLPSLSPLVTYTLDDDAYEPAGKGNGLKLVRPIVDFCISESPVVAAADFKTWAFSAAATMEGFDAIVAKGRGAPVRGAAKEEKSAPPISILLLKQLATGTHPAGRLACAYMHNIRLLAHPHALHYLNAFRLCNRLALDAICDTHTANDDTVLECLHAFCSALKTDPVGYTVANQWWIPTPLHRAALVDVCECTPEDADTIEALQAIKPFEYTYDVDETSPAAFCANIGTFQPGDDVVHVRHCDLHLERRLDAMVHTGALTVEQCTNAPDFHRRVAGAPSLVYEKTPRAFQLACTGLACTVSVCAAVVFDSHAREPDIRIGVARPLLVDTQVYALQLINVEHGSAAAVRTVVDRPNTLARTLPSGALHVSGCASTDAWWGILETWFDARTDATHITLGFSLSESPNTPNNTSILRALDRIMGSTRTPWLATPAHVIVTEAHMMEYVAWHRLCARIGPDVPRMHVCGDGASEANALEYPRGLVFRALLKHTHTVCVHPLVPSTPRFGTPTVTLSPHAEYALERTFDVATAARAPTVAHGSVCVVRRHLADGTDRLDLVVYDMVYRATLADGVALLTAPHPVTTGDACIRRISGVSGRAMHTTLRFETLGDTSLYQAPRTLSIGDAWNFPRGALARAVLDTAHEWTPSQIEKAQWLVGETDSQAWVRRCAALRISAPSEETSATVVGKPVFLLHTL